MIIVVLKEKVVVQEKLQLQDHLDLKALTEGHQKGPYWRGHNLVNFQFLAPPLRLCLCTRFVFYKRGFVLCVQILFFIRGPNPTNNMLLPH